MDFLAWMIMPLLTVDAGAPGMHVLVPIVQYPQQAYSVAGDNPGTKYTGTEVITTTCPDDIHVSRGMLSSWGGKGAQQEYGEVYLSEVGGGDQGFSLEAIFSIRPEATPKACIILVDGKPIQPAVMRVPDGEGVREIFVSDNLFRIVRPHPMPVDGGPGDADGSADGVITVPAADRSAMGVWVVDEVAVRQGQTLRFQALGNGAFMPHPSLRSAVVLSAGPVDIAGTLDVSGAPGGQDGAGGLGGPGGGGGGGGLPSLVFLDDWIVGAAMPGGWGYAGGGGFEEGGLGVLPRAADGKKREGEGGGSGGHGDLYLGGGDGGRLYLDCTSTAPCELAGADGWAGRGGSGDPLSSRPGGAAGQFAFGVYGDYWSGGCGGSYATAGLCARVPEPPAKATEASAAEPEASTYGTPFLVPHLGGSAGGGGVGAMCETGSIALGCDPDAPGGGGGGGGGAVVLVSWDRITVTGAIAASGGNGGTAIDMSGGTDDIVYFDATSGGGGSGGAVFLAAPHVAVTGALRVGGGTGGALTDEGRAGGRGGQGRVRIDGASWPNPPIGVTVFHGNPVVDQHGPRITVWAQGVWGLFTDEGTQIEVGVSAPGQTFDFSDEFAVSTRPLWFYTGTAIEDPGLGKVVFVPSPVGVAIIADRDRDGLFDDVEIDDWGTDPSNPDTDGDGLDDGAEVAADLDPTSWDTDEDGLGDGDEAFWQTDPTRADTDGDGLSDGDEIAYDTDPTLADTDGDDLSDGDEVFVHDTDPLRPDGDDDGLSDGDEIALGTDPFDRDTDRDLLWDGEEVDPAVGTDPLDPDSDDDGLWDGDEVLRHDTDPLSADTDGDGLSDGQEAMVHGSDPRVADTDGDGLGDAAEVAAGSDPRRVDTDGDTLSDGAEVAAGTSPIDRDTDGDSLDDGAEATRGTDPLDADTDDDGLSDGDEVVTHGTDPTEADTDGGCASDGVEVFHGTDPLDASDDLCEGGWIQGGTCDVGGGVGAQGLAGLLAALMFVRRRR